MSNESRATKGEAAANDFDEISLQLSALREDMMKLAKSVSGIASRRGNGMAADIAEGFSEAEHYVATKGKSAEAQLEGSVTANPLLALGLAAIAGLLIGALARR